MITPVEPVLPDGLDTWCVDALGSVPVEVLSVSLRVSRVFAVRLADDREAVVKARDHSVARATTCGEVQGRLAAAGFPVARPLTPVTACRGLAVHAEEHRPGGEVAADDGPDAAAASGRLFARAAMLLRREEVTPLPTPTWLDWGHDGPGPWPPSALFDAQEELAGLPPWLVDVAARTRRRLARASLPAVLGHGDWEAQNLRWSGAEPYVVHDWDSLARLPEAALAGAAAGVFASAVFTTLAPLESSAAFLDAYQSAMDRALDAEEVDVAWAAGLWPALHRARLELLYDLPPVAVVAVEAQFGERLRLAGA